MSSESTLEAIARDVARHAAPARCGPRRPPRLRMPLGKQLSQRLQAPDVLRDALGPARRAPHAVVDDVSPAAAEREVVVAGVIVLGHLLAWTSESGRGLFLRDGVHGRRRGAADHCQSRQDQRDRSSPHRGTFGDGRAHTAAPQQSSYRRGLHELPSFRGRFVNLGSLRRPN